MASNTPIRLYCCPFAGGNRYSFQRFSQVAPDWLEMVPMELPGRDRRAKEALVTDMEAMIEDLSGQIKASDAPYALYGHSMGAVLVALLARKTIERGQNPPIHVFVSGRDAPTIPAGTHYHHLPKAAFKERLRLLDGSPEEVLENPALWEYFEPILRADFELVETYCQGQVPPMDIPMTVMYGDNEGLTEADVMTWQSQSHFPLALRSYPGKHFYIFQHAEAIIKDISGTLLEAMSPSSIPHLSQTIEP